MKKFKKAMRILLACTFAVTMAMPIFACGDSGTSSGSGGQNQEQGKEGQVNTISASLLDGKVANFLSASGIAIQDKTRNGDTVSAMKAKSGARNIVASAEENTTITQPEAELVKQTESGVQDVHFHEEEEGSYTEWNDAYEVHHHDGQPCEVENCEQVSDEILAQEQEKPTVISLDARVNKLYNTGKYTFLCVSSAVEGQISLFTRTSRINMELSQIFWHNYGTWLNVEDHYYSEENPAYTVSYMRVETEEKSGMILVKRSDSEEGYHYSNYWSDDFNQSYLIDNETGKTYSLSALPYIYSVQNGVIRVAGENGSLRIYQPKIVDGELSLTEVEIPESVEMNYDISKPLIDIYGNVVFTTRTHLYETDEYGEIHKDGFIIAGTNNELAQSLSNNNGRYGFFKASAYSSANRYLLGSDGRIYRFDFRGETASIPVHVLNEQGQWSDVPETAHAVFTGNDRWFTNISVNAAKQQYLLLTQISNGKAYFVNAALGTDLIFTRNTDVGMYNEVGYFVGVSALPTDGSPDTAMQEFMNYAATSEAMDSSSIVYCVGDTAFAYEDKITNELVIWDRATETKQRIAAGEVIEGSLKGWRLCFMQDKAYMSTCFQANTANGAYYVSYDEENPTKAWSEYSQTPIEKTDDLDAYYRLLKDKN